MPIADIQISGPANWIDRSMLVWAAPPLSTSSGVAPNLVVVSDRLERPAAGDPNQAITDFGRAHIAKLTNALAEFRHHGEYGRMIANCSAFEVRTSWSNQNIRIAQQVVFLLRNPKEVLIFTATAAAHEFSQYAQDFESVIASLQFRSV